MVFGTDQFTNRQPIAHPWLQQRQPAGAPQIGGGFKGGGNYAVSHGAPASAGQQPQQASPMGDLMKQMGSPGGMAALGKIGGAFRGAPTNQLAGAGDNVGGAVVQPGSAMSQVQAPGAQAQLGQEMGGMNPQLMQAFQGQHAGPLSGTGAPRGNAGSPGAGAGSAGYMDAIAKMFGGAQQPGGGYSGWSWGGGGA